MTHGPVVSVCISAYNAERFLGEALGSVLRQTYPELEILVLDNGSADRTYDVARSFQDERLRVLRVADNLGAYQAMNRLATMATGRYLAIYHADDVYEPTIVEREVGHLESHPEVAAVFCTDHFINDEGRVFGGASLHEPFRGRAALHYGEVVTYLVRRKNTLFCCPTFMVRREVFEAVGPFRPETYGIGADLEMWLRIAREYPLAILDERLIRYRKGRYQWSARYREGRTEPDRFFQVIEEYLARDSWREKLTSEDLQEYAFHQADDAAFRAANLIRNGDLTGAQALLAAFRFPWRTLLVAPRRRKVRHLVLRTLLRIGMALGAARPLTLLLERIGP